MASPTKPILIIGAGISGLTLAQSCKKRDIPYRIYERDSSAAYRSAGWGLTIYWALQTFKDLLPDDVVAHLPDSLVNREAVKAGDKGTFTFFDLSTSEAKWRVPAQERIWVSRGGLRNVLLSGIEVQWAKSLSVLDIVEDRVKATFDDGTSKWQYACRLRRRQLCNQAEPPPFKLSELATPTVSAIRGLDSNFLQGSDLRTDAYLWFSFLDTPSDGAPSGKYRCQIMTSWPYTPGFLDRVDLTEIPNTKTGQMSLMRHLAEQWAEPFRSIVQSMPWEAEVRAIELAHWLLRRTTGYDGGVTLLGDAAHTMVMYRGEGANHTIADVSSLLEKIGPLYDDPAGESSRAGYEAARDAYEVEMIERTDLAVLASRRAYLDAHAWKRLNDNIPLVRRRLMKADLEL